MGAKLVGAVRTKGQNTQTQKEQKQNERVSRAELMVASVGSLLGSVPGVHNHSGPSSTVLVVVSEAS